MVDEARVNADQRAAELRMKADEAGDQAEHHWHEVRVDWDNHIKRVRERIDAKKAADDADAADFEAEWASADAADAVEVCGGRMRGGGVRGARRRGRGRTARTPWRP